MTKSRSNILKLSGFYLFTYLSFAFSYGYMQTFLSFVGYDVIERGIILSGSAIVAIVTQFVIGYLCDKYKTDKLFFNISLIIFAISSLVMYQVTQQNFYLHLIFVSLVGGMFKTTLMVQDTWTLQIDESCKKNFGSIRAFGAIGWMIGTPVGAFIIMKYGYPALGYVFCGMSVANILFTMCLSDAVKTHSEVKLKINDLKILILSKKYVTVVLIFLFVNIISTADMFTTTDKMLLLGANEAQIGARMSIQAFLELPLFFAGAYLIKKFGDYKLMMFGTLMYLLRFVLYSYVQSVDAIILVAVMQCITYPLIMITSKTLIDEATPDNLKSSGQNIAGAFYGGVSLLITPFISGILISSFGIDTSLLIIGLSGIFPLALGIYYKRIKNN